MEEELELTVNGRARRVRVAPDTPLLFVLRNNFGLTGAKFGCGLEQCGACKVLVDGEARPTCRAPAPSFVGRTLTTIEGLGTPEHLHPIQQAFVDEEAAQCGFCIPGMVIGAADLLARNPDPSDGEIREALAIHLCRCGTHARILRAVRRAARAMRR
ncbi:MAG TPA: (2Fe-2S)-binding protein [Myxococcota bacterium]|nr:(2Fe-2S)-binding protein [Myxococcota bacterium]